MEIDKLLKKSLDGVIQIKMQLNSYPIEIDELKRNVEQYINENKDQLDLEMINILKVNDNLADNNIKEIIKNLDKLIEAIPKERTLIFKEIHSIESGINTNIGNDHSHILIKNYCDYLKASYWLLISNKMYEFAKVVARKMNGCGCFLAGVN